jgi:aryl-alcohol dehydrogenase-like predicted oxidoreductase
MDYRLLGQTGHKSSIVTLGCCALGRISQPVADDIIELALSRGVNHFDVAPMYGDAELRLRPWMMTHRKDIFLACKTNKWRKTEAAKELQQSLERLGTDYIDLYQFHGLDGLSDLDAAFGPDGALQAMREAKDDGLIRYIGMTSHRPATLIEALRRYDLDTVLFPLNFIITKYACPENEYETLLTLAKQKKVGTIVMKAFAKRPWPPHVATQPRESRPYSTWYEPFDQPTQIDLCLWYALSQGVTTVASACDVRLVPAILNAAERYRRLTPDEQTHLVNSAEDLLPLCQSSTFYTQHYPCDPSCCLLDASSNDSRDP